jgi:hypothetical protein
MLRVFYLGVACVSHTFQVYVPNISSAFDVCCIQVFHISKVESHRGMARAPGDGERQADASGRVHDAHLG